MKETLDYFPQNNEYQEFNMASGGSGGGGGSGRTVESLVVGDVFTNLELTEIRDAAAGVISPETVDDWIKGMILEHGASLFDLSDPVKRRELIEFVKTEAKQLYM